MDDEELEDRIREEEDAIIAKVTKRDRESGVELALGVAYRRVRAGRRPPKAKQPAEPTGSEPAGKEEEPCSEVETQEPEPAPSAPREPSKAGRRGEALVDRLFQPEPAESKDRPKH